MNMSIYAYTYCLQPCLLFVGGGGGGGGRGFWAARPAAAAAAGVLGPSTAPLPPPPLKTAKPLPPLHLEPSFTVFTPIDSGHNWTTQNRVGREEHDVISHSETPRQ
jgi:hypothetical protein